MGGEDGISVVFLFNRKAAFEMLRSLVGSEMCIRVGLCGLWGRYMVMEVPLLPSGHSRRALSVLHEAIAWVLALA